MATDLPRSIVARHSRKFALAWATLACLAALVGATLLKLGAGHPLIDEIEGQISYRIIQPIADALLYHVLGVEFLLLVGVTLLLQFFLPAKPEERMWSSGLLVDGLYFFVATLQYPLLVTLYVSFLADLHKTLFGGFALFNPDDLPFLVQAVVAFLLYDFLRYAQHVLKHKVPFLWQFHTIHHSQQNLTVFTIYRSHFVDLFIQLTSTAVPFLFLGFDKPYVIGTTLIAVYYAQFYHANLRINFGPLHYVLVTPQSHRIHHSSAPEHTDKNFGDIFSIWDQLFGTRVWDTKIYPNTGVPDSDFPHEQRSSLWVLLATPMVQMLYPFEVIWRKYISRAKPVRLAESPAE